MHHVDGGQESEGWMRKEKNIQEQLLTSFGLFFAGATPVKPDRKGKKKKGEGYQCTFSISSMLSKKRRLKRRLQNNVLIYPSSPSPFSPLSPCLVLCSPIRGWRLRREEGEGGCRQRDLSASLPRPALWLDWCSGRVGPAPRANPALTRPWLPQRQHTRANERACV